MRRHFDWSEAIAWCPDTTFPLYGILDYNPETKEIPKSNSDG